MKRLKGIGQYGSWSLLNPELDTTRFDHSVGVMILLKKFNAPLNEQIAGLIHDISHTAFSHALDFVYNRSQEQDLHEKFYERVLLNSKVPSILERHGLELKGIIDANSGLLDRDLPGLCADRLDYFLRDMLLLKRMDNNKVNNILSSLIVLDNELIFTTKTSI